MFEYHYEETYGENANRRLNQLGQQGWQLHTMLRIGDGPQFAFVLMRYWEPEQDNQGEKDQGEPMRMG